MSDQATNIPSDHVTSVTIHVALSLVMSSFFARLFKSEPLD